MLLLSVHILIEIHYAYEYECTIRTVAESARTCCSDENRKSDVSKKDFDDKHWVIFALFTVRAIWTVTADGFPGPSNSGLQRIGGRSMVIDRLETTIGRPPVRGRRRSHKRRLEILSRPGEFAEIQRTGQWPYIFIHQ